ncbi:lanthionine synthetase LanC family protein [Nonomuraea sp. NPDC046802]|uniref:lanthionine synthetase LanC family protein n=1 Tax=Nonomuraea sp. NPDC046802 TaxID=3154919 RepID=UPI003407436F
MEDINGMALLSRWRTTDEAGPRWPHLITPAHFENGEPPERGRDSWCYGAAGAARAVYLAGAALDRADWRADAHAAFRGALTAGIALALHTYATGNVPTTSWDNALLVNWQRTRIGRA